MRLLNAAWNRSARKASKLVNRSAWSPLEQLENRQLLALTGVVLTEFPRGSFDVTGQTTYDEVTDSFDIVASPISVRLSVLEGPIAILGGHGDVQIHAKINSAGQFVRGVTSADTPGQGTINAAGDDLIIRGDLDLDGSGTIEAGETGQVLLTGEMYAFGFQDSGGPTDAFDMRFVPTGGALMALIPAGRDIGIIITCETSTFTGSFAESFSGGAKGTFGPIQAPEASLAGTIYCDRDLSGSLTAGDVGIEGVAVTLSGINDIGQPVNFVTQTLANGTYSFTGLRPGTYTISEVSPAGTVEGTNTVGTANGVVLNEDAIGEIPLGNGVDGTGYNFGYICLGGISGTKYKDKTGNGLTGDDTPLAGTVIYLDLNNSGALDPSEPSQTTGADGSFAFSDLLPGTYTVREVVPTGFYQTFPTGNGTYSVGVTPGAVVTGRNFSNAEYGKIKGTKYLDITGNGLSSDDTGLGGTVIYIDADNDGKKDAGERWTTTASDGSYTFDNLLPGAYIVREVVPANYVRTFPTNSDKYNVTLTNGQCRENIVFANARGCDCWDVTNVQFSINNTKYVSDLRGNTDQGDVVTVTFTIPAGQGPERFTLVSYTAPSGVWDANVASQQMIFDVETGMFGPGTHTMTVTIPNCYYQIDFVCGYAIDQLGPVGSNIFYSAQKRLISADNDGNKACVDDAASLSGFVWLDDDNDGNYDSNEMPIAGAKITLTWTQSGSTKTVTEYTDQEGRYLFSNLSPSFTYKLTETQPSGYTDGKDKLGNSGGTLTNDAAANITLAANENASNYNFGERNVCDVIGSKNTATVAFWTSTAGQNLIKSFNGGSGALNLGMWLGENFANLFGSSAGASNMKGKSNSQVASALVSRASSNATKLEAEVFALALSVYATNSAWAGGTMAQSYGFTVNLAGSGLSLFAVGSNGSALGLPNNSSQTILAQLKGANNAASNGTIASGNNTVRTNLFNYFRSINAAGGITA